MRIIFIRHGQPDYTTDTLDAQGKLEVAALTERTKHWKVEDFYVSTMGRAKETIAPTLACLGREATEYDWMREFTPRLIDPSTGEEHCAWDLMPQDYLKDPLMFDKDHWFDAALYQQNPEIKERALWIYKELDQLLEKYGYMRNGDAYDFVDPTGHVNPAEPQDIMLHGTSNYVPRDTDDDKTIVITCHFGVTCVMLGHLLGISPVMLWHGTCIPPTGVTILNAEKRLHNVAHFRTQALGDTSHLKAAGVQVSGYAGFALPFQG